MQRRQIYNNRNTLQEIENIITYNLYLSHLVFSQPDDWFVLFMTLKKKIKIIIKCSLNVNAINETRIFVVIHHSTDSTSDFMSDKICVNIKNSSET